MLPPITSLQTIISALACLCPNEEGYKQFGELQNLSYIQKEPDANRLNIITESLQKFEQKLENIERTQARILSLLETNIGIQSNDKIEVRTTSSRSSCSNLLLGKSQVISVRLEKRSFDVLCARSEVDNGVWLVIQRRYDGSENFYRNWEDYKNGFGSLDGEFFIGLEKLYELTKSDNYELLITLENFNSTRRYAKYGDFTIGNEDEFFEIKKLGKYEGDAGDSFTAHKFVKFSTYDKDNDNDITQNCAQEYKSGWWFSMCLESNLNGEYIGAVYPKNKFGHGIVWALFRGYDSSLKAVEMAIRVKSY